MEREAKTMGFREEHHNPGLAMDAFKMEGT